MRCQKGICSTQLFWEILTFLPLACRWPAAGLPLAYQTENAPKGPPGAAFGFLWWEVTWGQALDARGARFTT